jgi:hypothetical protein
MKILGVSWTVLSGIGWFRLYRLFLRSKLLHDVYLYDRTTGEKGIGKRGFTINGHKLYVFLSIVGFLPCMLIMWGGFKLIMLISGGIGTIFFVLWGVINMVVAGASFVRSLDT